MGISDLKDAPSMDHPGEDSSGLKKILTLSRVYDLFQNLIGGKNSRRWIASEVWRLAGGEKVVDIGCGPGSSLDYLPADITYYGIDISEAYIESARKKYGGRGTFLIGTTADFVNAGRGQLNDADVVLSNGLLHHLPDEKVLEVFNLAKQILKPGGRLIGVEATYLRRQTYLSRWVVSRDRGRYIRSEEEWKHLIQKIFKYYRTSVVTGLIRIPYTHLIIECFAEDSTSLR